jgi:ubiquinone/menaquinone biosynthesis C-methylase UbiE
MKDYNQFICPKTKKSLSLSIDESEGENIINGALFNDECSYPIIDNIVNLCYPKILAKEETEIIRWYENNYKTYDDYLPITFETFDVDEIAERIRMISLLDINPNDKVLETGAGTGRDSALIAKYLSEEGELHVTDIYVDILEISKKKLENCKAQVYHCVVNALHLPYPDNYFDKYYHFGGWNTFSDKKKAFEEVSRVVKPGGKIIIGDESMPPWLLGSNFSNVLINTNSHYSFPLPLSDMHFTARNVSVNYIMGGVFYFIYYEKGEGYPYANFDIPIPGPRGGTLNTRYFGRLEGVSEEVFNLAKEAIKNSGKSAFDWFNDVVKRAALNDLKE